MSAEDDRKGTETVKAVLREKSIHDIDFMMGDITVSPSMYDKVLKAIETSKIAVLVLPSSLPNIAAKYFPVLTISADTEFYDVIALKSPDLGTGLNTQFQAAMAIVHECTHAG